MAWLDADDCNIDDFLARRETARANTRPLNWVSEIVREIPVYDCANLRDPLIGTERRQILEEWHHVFGSGAGAIVLRGALSDLDAVDAATQVFNRIMADQRADGRAKGDHFGKPGANDRIWNSLEKLCLAAPDIFVRYYGNVFLAAASEAWLGPNWQMTSQTNLVHPGGEGQTAHRDYHLGFMTAEEAARYPAVVHRLSPCLTLQGGIAHVDMPVESGPTKLLPYSQLYEPGYLAYRLTPFSTLFDAEHVQLPLAKGDAVFFNPALFHGAGSNHTADVARLVNLLQVGSAFGRSIETVNRERMCVALYPALQQSDLPEAELQAAIACCAEGYAFPTNLDHDQPVGGLAPATQADLMRAALSAGTAPDTFAAEIAAHAERRRA